MKKLLITLLFSLLMSAAANAAAANEEYNNPGYYETNGVLGVYGFSSNYLDKDNNGGSISGGAFVYYNILNKIGGNLAIGLSTDYSPGKFDNGIFKAKTNAIPVALNIAYMTASDFLNLWAGLGFTYTFADIEITEGSVPNRINGGFGSQGKESVQLMGGDVFAGIEYIFSESKKLGAFFEFRLSFTESTTIKRYVPEQLYSFEDNIDFSKMRFTFGVNYHF